MSIVAVCAVQASIAPKQTANDGIPVFIGTSLFSLLVALVAAWRAVVRYHRLLPRNDGRVITGTVINNHDPMSLPR